MLSILIWAPIVGAIVIGVLPQQVPLRSIRNVALGVMIGVFLWTLVILAGFDITVAGLQFSEQITWIPELGLSYELGVDGISLPLVVLNSLLN